MSRSSRGAIQARDTASEALEPVFAIAVSFLIINTIFLVLRFYSVLFLRKTRLGLTWDDYFLIPAWLCTAGISIISLVLYHWETTDNPSYGGDGSIHDFWRLVPILKSIFALLQLLVPAYAFTRFSILALYLRVFNSRIVRFTSYFLIAFICCQWLAYSLASVFQCKPVAYYWNKRILGGHCININKFNRSFTPANIAADFIIVVLPLPTIWGLRASKFRKAGYTFILGLGSLALAASVVRAAMLQQNDTTILKPYVTNEVIQWLIIEPSIYFITACLPAMHPLFRLLAPPQLRRAAQAKVDNNKHKHPSSSKTPIASGTNGSMTRLTDTPDILSHPPSGKAAAILGAAGGVPPSEVQGRAKGSATPSHTATPAVPLQDLKQVEGGERIMVKTEIITSQEEKMEEVIGF